MQPLVVAPAHCPRQRQDTTEETRALVAETVDECVDVVAVFHAVNNPVTAAGRTAAQQRDVPTASHAIVAKTNT